MFPCCCCCADSTRSAKKGCLFFLSLSLFFCSCPIATSSAISSISDEVIKGPRLKANEEGRKPPHFQLCWKLLLPLDNPITFHHQVFDILYSSIIYNIYIYLLGKLLCFALAATSVPLHRPPSTLTRSNRFSARPQRFANESGGGRVNSDGPSERYEGNYKLNGEGL